MQVTEMVSRMHEEYTSDDCVQLMLSYIDYLIFFGNNDLMYFKNYTETEPSLYNGYVNEYLKDKRRKSFPYHNIEEHIDRVFFNKLTFANQILDYERPYIKVADKIISQVVPYHDSEGSYIHTKILNGEFGKTKCYDITRSEIENYSKIGSFSDKEDKEYQECFIFNLEGSVYGNRIASEEEWINQEKDRLRRVIKNDDRYGPITKFELTNAIDNLDEIAPFDISPRLMLKFKSNGEIDIDLFQIKYVRRGVYKLFISTAKPRMETLSSIKEKLQESKIQKLREPRISYFLNPDIPRNEVKEAKQYAKERRVECQKN